MTTSDSILEVRDLRKVYKKGLFSKSEVAAIDGVSLQVGRGSVFGLLGPNGAGKTTMIKCLLGLVRRFEGEARLFGLHPDDPASRRKVGYLPEAHRLPGHLTGRQVMHLFGALAGSSPEDVKKRVDPLLERVDMMKAADRKVREYSKGMQQRIGLAQALVNDPELVFLDEPTDGVDPIGRAAIRELVTDLKNRGTTLFINSHLLMEVEMICDRVVIMHKGRIIRQGTIDELTPRTGAVRFEIGSVPTNLKEILAGVGADFALDGHVVSLKVNEAELDQAIDRLRSARISIRSITQRRATLEESFIGLVQKGVQ
ncbi:MAG: ABC transporter ATP-binding protein [Planctomycetota bacterium]|nr:ABC transporter ATP-binding protein [Planctomycetota bacterium]